MRYLLRNVIYAIISFVLIVVQLLWDIHKNLVLDLLYESEYREMGQAWWEMFTPEDVWKFLTVLLIAFYCYCIGVYAIELYEPPKEQVLDTPKELPRNIKKLTKGFVSCGGVLILACWIATVVFIYNMVGGCD